MNIKENRGKYVKKPMSVKVPIFSFHPYQIAAFLLRILKLIISLNWTRFWLRRYREESGKNVNLWEIRYIDILQKFRFLPQFYLYPRNQKLAQRRFKIRRGKQLFG